MTGLNNMGITVKDAEVKGEQCQDEQVEADPKPEHVHKRSQPP